MKYYIYHRLVLVKEGKIITDQQMVDELTRTGFTVPPVIPLKKLKLPKPVPQPSTPELNAAWRIKADPIIEENEIRVAADEKQYTDFEAALKQKGFKIARLFKDAKGNKSYVIPENPDDVKYTHKQAAQKLMGRYSSVRPADPVDFIAFNRFG